MKCSRVISLVSAILVLFSVVTLEIGCASIVPPTGGPRDTLPPVLLKVTPADSTRNFEGKKVVLSFDEFVQIDNVQKNLLVSPTPKINPQVEAKLRTITITIKDTLEDNTTYSYDFGRAIKDINEGNVLKDYTYLFSTGSNIDSLQLSGKVVVAETGAIDSTLMVLLHTNMTDSAVIKERPRYRARLDTTGRFQFNNLAPGSYAIYALKDESGIGRYMSKNQLFAFADSAITSQSQRRDIVLYAYTEKDTTKKEQPAIAAPPPPKKGGPNTDRLLKFQTNVSGEPLDLLSNLEFVFGPDPLRSFDSSGVHFLDANFAPLKNYHFVRDTSNKKITLVHPWIESTQYNVILDTTFAQDTMGRKLLRTDTVSFQTKSVSEYGSVRIRFPNIPLNRNPVLQFVQNDQIKHSHVFTNNLFYVKLFQPGDYTLRIVFDENKNGVWDPGEFFKKRQQPEKVQLIPKKLTVKPNWDADLSIEL